MGRLNNLIAKIAPEYAMKREIAQQRLKRLQTAYKNERSFDAVAGGRLRYNFLTDSRSPDSSIANDIKSLRNHVRQMEYNSGFVSGPIQRIVKNVVGQGIRYQGRVMADDNDFEFPRITQAEADAFNYSAEKHFKQWAKRADKRLMVSFWEIQSLAEAALIRDGECLVIGRTSGRRDRLIPYCLEVLEADRLQTPPEEIQNPRIRNGIRFDDEGAPVSYFLLKAHPGESLSILHNASDFEEVPAFNANGTRKVMHLFNPLRPEQTRGFSQYAAGLKDLQDLERYMEAEKIKTLEAACITGMVTTENPVGYVGNYTQDSGSDDYERIHEFAPGKWHYFKPGEKAEIFNPNKPNEAFGDYIDQLVRGPANALDIPPEVFSQNWRGMNYSNARTVLLQFYAACAERQFFLINHLCTPVWENVARWLIVKGKVPATGFDRRPEDYLRSAWIPSVYRKWVDPLKEAKGKETNVNNHFETLSDIHAEQGKDFDEVMETRARELRKIKELEEKYDISLGAGGAGSDEPVEDDEEEAGGLPPRVYSIKGGNRK